ncbi:MAG TPA: glucose 1-dehydrogenase [Bryobacteraceae bacterium]|nr:glucose 1-dehydrogenase [Bryobacteraceae bacterium]
MRAITVVPGTPAAHVVERPEPKLSAPDQVKLQVLRVGICGTDREQAAGGRALVPDGQRDLVMGHEMFGRVVEVGDKVRSVKPGDYALFTVRRGCGKCTPCHLKRPDMCRTGDYRERGIWGLDGFQAQFVVDTEDWLVHVPESIAHLGVLAEPMSVIEKAIDEAVRIQVVRMPAGQATPNWLNGRRCLVAGLGPIGMLAGMVLRLRGAEVWGMDVVPADSARPKWFANIGCCYLDGREVKATQIDEKAGTLDLIVEATGVPNIMFELIDALAEDGIAALTGIPHGDRRSDLPAADLARQLVLSNRILLGSVNAARDHFQMGIDDLGLAHLRWGGLVEDIITHRYPVEKIDEALGKKPEDEIKAVIEWM